MSEIDVLPANKKHSGEEHDPHSPGPTKLRAFIVFTISRIVFQTVIANL